MNARPGRLPIPYGPHSLTAEWLSQALKADVRSFKVDAIRSGRGKGFTGQVARITVEHATPDLPGTIIAKFPPSGAEARAALNSYQFYEREARFYKELAESVNLRTPTPYYVDVNSEAAESVLLLEDLVGAKPFELVTGITRQEAEFTLRSLARFHADWWDSAKLHQHAWLKPFDWNAEKAQKQYIASYPSFVEKMRGGLPDDLERVGAQLENKITWVQHELSRPPLTLLHGDFYPNNLLTTGNPPVLAVVDWQACARGRAARDLMFFIATALRLEDRRSYDTDLIGMYHSELTAHGVAGYSLDDCMRDFRLSLLDLMQYMVTLMLLLDFDSDRGRALRDLALERWGGAIRDHSAAALLS